MPIVISNPTQSPETAAQPTHVLASGLAAILASLLLYVAASFRPLGTFTLPVWTRISRAAQRLARLLARAAEGRLPLPRAPISGAAPRRGGPPAPYLPRRFGWLVHTAGFQIANHASQLTQLLNDPATNAALAILPPHAMAALTRALRPLCRLLGVTLPPTLQPPEPARPIAPRKPRAPRPLPFAIPLPANIRAAVRAWKRKPA